MLLGAIAQDAWANLPNGIYRIRPAASSKYLDVANSDITTPGARFQLWDYLGGLNQHFLIESTSNPNTYQVRLSASRRALQATPATMNTNGGAITLGNSTGAAHQRWRIQPIPGSNRYTIRLAANGKSLDAGADTLGRNGGIVQIYDFNDRFNQQWVIEPVPGLRVIPRTTWQPRLQTLFNQTSVRLNNYTPNRNEFDRSSERAYFRPNDSFFRTVMGGREFRLPISIPVMRRDPSSIYVVDLNTNRIGSSFVGAANGYDSGKLRINLGFESEGREFWTNCINNAGCFAIGDRSVEMNGARFRIDLEPMPASGGGITYRNNVDASLNADIAVSGCRDDLFAFLCDIFAPNAGGQIQRNVETTVESFFNSGTLRPLVSTVISTELGINPSQPVRSIRVYQNGDLEVVQP